MGAAFGWRCENCGAGEGFSTGSGMRSFNVSETHARIRRGKLGKIAKHLLSDDCPLDVNTIDASAYFRCPDCSALGEGAKVMLTVKGDKFDLALHVPPERCPRCGGNFEFAENRVPVSDGEIREHVMRTAESGCPECGSKAVKLEEMCWD